MCGITGYYTFSGQDNTLWDRLSTSVATLTHRGPDDSGVWRGSHSVGLGHARLSIIDLSPQGHQPMLSPDGQWAMVFNGEVYNYEEIRSDLESEGYSFRSSSDSEVVLAAFSHWGGDAVQRFIGMFAMAIWSEKDRTLRLFRDRLGVKPLYYSWDGKAILFASELKALRAFAPRSPEIDLQVLGEFFQYGYIAAPRTIYQKTYKLSPGHMLELREGGEPVVRQYWSVLEAVQDPLPGTEDRITEQLEELLVSAFRYRMVADVPVGVFLSGGVDSSLVTALLQKHSGEQIHTFTIGFRENKYDESVWARKVAEHLGTIHTEKILDASQAQQILVRWGDLYDEPFGDSSGIPTYLVSKVAREHVKVALSADGGDELFGGYSSYNQMPGRWKAINSIPSGLRSAFCRSLGLLPKNVITSVGKTQGGESKLIDRVEKLRLLLLQPSPSAYFNLAASHWLSHEVEELLGKYRSPRHGIDSYSGSFAEQMMLWDLHHYLPDDILAKVDRASMAVGLEGREPLIDHRVVEFAFRLPLHLRIGQLGSKHLLRKILYRHVPRELIDRPKQGFAVPIATWLRGDLSYLLDQYLAPDRIHDAGILNPKIVNETVANFRCGRCVNVTKVWLLLAFEMWRETWQ